MRVHKLTCQMADAAQLRAELTQQVKALIEAVRRALSIAAHPEPGSDATDVSRREELASVGHCCTDAIAQVKLCLRAVADQASVDDTDEGEGSIAIQRTTLYYAIVLGRMRTPQRRHTARS